MFSLPDVAQNYAASAELANYVSQKENKKYLSFYRQLKEGQEAAKQAAVRAGQQFDPQKFQKKFMVEYFKANEITPEEFNQNISLMYNIFIKSSQALGIYGLVNIKEGLKNYASSQKKIKEIVNCLEFNASNIESLLTSDDANLTKTNAKSESIKSGSEKALKEYIKRYSKDYDNLSIKDFKGDNVSDEVALYRFAQHVFSLFSASNQAKDERKKRSDDLRKCVKPLNPLEFNILKKINGFELKKLDLNDKASKTMRNANYSASQIDDILGGDYINKKNWNQNLSLKFLEYYDALIKNSQAQ